MNVISVLIFNFEYLPTALWDLTQIWIIRGWWWSNGRAERKSITAEVKLGSVTTVARVQSLRRRIQREQNYFSAMTEIPGLICHLCCWTWHWLNIWVIYRKNKTLWRSDLKPVREPFCSVSMAKKIKVENAYFEVLLHHDPIKYIHKIMVLPKVTWCTVKVNFSACKYASNLLPQLCTC